MSGESDDQSDLLSDSSEETFGRGTELPTTDFLVFGLVTFWVYTVWRYWGILERHLSLRLQYFRELLSTMAVPPKGAEAVETIIRNGFTCRPAPKYISLVLYAVSMSLIVALLAYKHFTGHLGFNVDIVVVGIAAVSFCGSSIFFMGFVCRTLKEHEYHELLFWKLAQDPHHFTLLQPSNRFIKRWNRAQSWVAFFLVLSIPMTFSPIVGVYHFYSTLEDGVVFSEVVALGWIAALLVLAAAFHVGGTEILLGMYNNHLRIETINRPAGEKGSPWTTSESGSVITCAETDSSLVSTAEAIPQRMLAAIMITDMVGFSADMESREETAYLKLQRHNEIIRRHIARNHGEEIKTMGDAFLIRYGSAVGAVRAAVNIQRDFSDYNEGREDEAKIVVRIGVHIGDVLLMGKDVIGNGVNVASRIEPLAEPGGVCISADIYNIVRKSIDIKVVSLGKQELKNISESPELYKIIIQSVEKGMGADDKAARP